MDVLIHGVFSLIYVLLLLRAAIALYDGPSDISNLPDSSVPLLIVKRICGIIYGPFWAFGIPLLFGGDYLLFNAIFMAILFYGLIHYGVIMRTDTSQSVSTVGNILQLCRALFFFAGAILVLLVCIRMAVMLYHDVVYSRPNIGIVVPER